MRASATPLRSQEVMERLFISTSRIRKSNLELMYLTAIEDRMMEVIHGSILTFQAPEYLSIHLIATTDRIFCTAVMEVMRCSDGRMLTPLVAPCPPYPFP